MTEVVLFHHAQGLTPGVRSLADRIADAGYRVRTPDLYDGRTFASLVDGVEFARAAGFEEIAARGVRAVEPVEGDVVLVGISLGAVPAEGIAVTRPGVSGVVLVSGIVPPAALEQPWPDGLALQVHAMADDPDGDVEDAREVVAELPAAELFVYDGGAHLFVDDSLPGYDEAATDLFVERVLEFLADH
ncbi:dienelactone hydrolase family protein [Kineococcus aurantiacus]|uniref:Dienelactone hydrolase n=1 Tax=Kineococcus aurantiacus TaxID=37633 RepID=A0A7Y9ASE0_9ACTN|nr:dienelactone hydrolase [Kineococcus aurantiacus]